MRTGVSSAVVPGASLSELTAGATRHGLSVLELRAGDGHGVSASMAAEAGALARVGGTVSGSGIAISAYRDHGLEDEHGLGALASVLCTSILIDGEGTLAARLTRAQRLRHGGAAVAVVARGPDAASDAREIVGAGLAVAWDAAPADGQLGERSAEMLGVCGGALRQVRIAGGGPESALHEGRGIGALMARLALAGYAGTVIIAPSTPRYHLLWEQWLGRRRGWGCGSRASDPALVTLELPATSGGAA